MIPAEITSGQDDEADFAENPDLGEEAASSGSAELKIDANANDTGLKDAAQHQNL